MGAEGLNTCKRVYRGTKGVAEGCQGYQGDTGEVALPDFRVTGKSTIRVHRKACFARLFGGF